MKRIGSKSKWMMSWVIMLMTPSKFFFCLLLPLFVFSLPSLPVYSFYSCLFLLFLSIPYASMLLDCSVNSCPRKWHHLSFRWFPFSSNFIHPSTFSLPFFFPSPFPSILLRSFRDPVSSTTAKKQEIRQRKWVNKLGEEKLRPLGEGRGEIIQEKWKGKKCSKIEKNLKQQNQKTAAAKK